MIKGSDIWLFIGVFVGLFILWVVTGGPSRPLSWAGPFLNAPAPLGSGKAYFLPGAGFTSGGTGFTIGTSNAHITVSNSSGAVAITNPSPYRGKIYFQSPPAAAETANPNSEYVGIAVAATVSAPIDIMGWRLVSANTNAPLPSGTLIPEPSGQNRIEDIVLHGGDTAFVTSGNSPIGISYRDNECTPYIGGLYNNCFADHINDPNFAGTSWRIYLNSGVELWRNDHDTIRLLDAQGKTVDVLTY